MSKRGLPFGIKLVSWATAIRWLGWGLFEALLPIFLFTFAKSYAETGIFSSIYDIVFLLSLPIAGLLADRVASRTIIIIGLIIYPFIGASYFLAGLTTFAFFIVIARFLNGFSYAFDAVGRDTYFRTHAPKSKVSTAFGYQNTITHFGWLIAVFASLFIVLYVKIHWLFLAIIPTTIITLIMIKGLRVDKKGSLRDGLKKSIKTGFYSEMFREVKSWNLGLKLLGLISFFFGFIATFVELFIPIYAYTQGANLQQVILITILLNLPMLFGTILGKLADKNRKRCLFVSIILAMLLLLTLSFVHTYYLQLIVAFGMGIVLHLMELVNDGVSTHLSERRHYGRVSSAMEAISSLGNLVGPIVIGLSIDARGLPSTALIISIATFVILLIAFAGRKQLEKSVKR